MKRRKYLATLGSGAFSVGAGCLDFSSGFKVEQILFEDLRDDPSAIFDATVEFNGDMTFNEEIDVGDQESAYYRLTDLPEEAGEYNISISVPNLDVGEFSYPPEERDVADCVVLQISIQNIGSDGPELASFDHTCEYWESTTNQTS